MIITLSAAPESGETVTSLSASASIPASQVAALLALFGQNQDQIEPIDQDGNPFAGQEGQVKTPRTTAQIWFTLASGVISDVVLQGRIFARQQATAAALDAANAASSVTVTPVS